MSFARRLPVTLSMAVGAAALALAPAAAADPVIEGQSATTVIDQFQREGYAVQVNGSPAGDISLLRGCTVTSVQKPGDPGPTTVNLSVACPLTHG